MVGQQCSVVVQCGGAAVQCGSAVWQCSGAVEGKSHCGSIRLSITSTGVRVRPSRSTVRSDCRCQSVSQPVATGKYLSNNDLTKPAADASECIERVRGLA